MNTLAHSPFKPGHIGLNVSDLERAKAFYRTVFGFELMGESHQDGRRFAFLGDGHTLVLTLWQQSAGRFERDRPGLHHLAFQVESLEQVREAEARVRALNARFLHEGIVAHAEGAASGGIFFEDPDGIRLEIYAPTGLHGHAAATPDAPACGFF